MASQSTRSMLLGRGFAGLFAEAIKVARSNDVHMKQIATLAPHAAKSAPAHDVAGQNGSGCNLC